MGFIQDCGSAAGTFCASGQKVALSATASVGSLLLLHAQVGAQYGVHDNLGLTVCGFRQFSVCCEIADSSFSMYSLSLGCFQPLRGFFYAQADVHRVIVFYIDDIHSMPF